MKVTGLDYTKVIERYERGMRLYINTGDHTLLRISNGVVEIPPKAIDPRLAW